MQLHTVAVAAALVLAAGPALAQTSAPAPVPAAESSAAPAAEASIAPVADPTPTPAPSPTPSPVPKRALHGVLKALNGTKAVLKLADGTTHTFSVTSKTAALLKSHLGKGVVYRVVDGALTLAP